MSIVAKRKQMLSTTDDAIDRAEQALGRKLPASAREWYREHNGKGPFAPIRDEREPRTWDDLVELREGFVEYSADCFGLPEPDIEHLLTILCEGDYVCLDYGDGAAEPRVVLVSHETGEAEPLAPTFRDFVDSHERGDVDF